MIRVRKLAKKGITELTERGMVKNFFGSGIARLGGLVGEQEGRGQSGEKKGFRKSERGKKDRPF